MTVFGLCRDEREGEREKKNSVSLFRNYKNNQLFQTTTRARARKCGAASAVLSRSFCGK